MRKLLFIALLVASPLAAGVARAQAQVSDADRAAARDLFYEGVKLQNDGKFADALDRFSRGQRIFSAPTQLLHIAECQVALGQLVEGSETYRTLVRTPLPQGSPAAFTQAQQQGAAELAQVEPRIPFVKIDVTPANVQNLQVQVDGTTMNAALVGVSRPIDPGAHKVTVFAPGYGKQDAQFALKEREQKTVPIALQSTGGVVYAPATGGPPPLTTAPPPPPYEGNPPPPPPTEPPPPASDQSAQWQTARRAATTSLLVGLKLGVVFPAGAVSADANNKTFAMSDAMGTGVALGLQGGLRFATHWFAGLGYEHGFFGKGSDETVEPPAFSPTVSTNMVDLRFAYISHPNGVGFYGELGIGYRWLVVGLSNPTLDASFVFRGAEFSLGGGVFIKAGDYVRLIPKINFGIGSFGTEDITCSGNACSTAGLSNTSSSIANTQVHTFVFLGLDGYYNIDLGKH